MSGNFLLFHQGNNLLLHGHKQCLVFSCTASNPNVAGRQYARERVNLRASSLQISVLMSDDVPKSNSASDVASEDTDSFMYIVLVSSLYPALGIIFSKATNEASFFALMMEGESGSLTYLGKSSKTSGCVYDDTIATFHLDVSSVEGRNSLG